MSTLNHMVQHDHMVKNCTHDLIPNPFLIEFYDSVQTTYDVSSFSYLVVYNPNDLRMANESLLFEQIHKPAKIRVNIVFVYLNI